MGTSGYRLALAALVLLAAAAGAEARTLKIATVVPDGTSWMKEMRQAAKEIEQRTQGRVELKFYPGGVMGNDKTVMRKIRAGQLQGGALSSGALAKVYPETEIYSLPLVFRSYDEVDYVRQKMDPQIAAGLEKAGFVPLAISDQGFAYLLSQKPVRKVSDLEGAKVWIQEGDVLSETALGLAGVTPVQLPLGDVYTALQTGLVDTVAAPPYASVAFQWHTKVKYLTDVPLMYLIGVLVVDAKAWKKISSADQAVIREVVGEASRRLDQESRKGDEEAREALAKQGIEFVAASSDEEVERWRDISRQTIEEMRRKGRYSNDMIDAIGRHLEEYRSRSQGGGGG
jgi:TRAP-type C4-dicarboxylate transport system substrate-binding protein